MSKIQIWKRITTITACCNSSSLLYLICQRYKFESESQHTRMNAIRVTAVFNMSKIQIWKRITTLTVYRSNLSLLYLICQRYKFESESQQSLWTAASLKAVFNMSKIQIWKRITTILYNVSPLPGLYLICQRYKFESESQLGAWGSMIT